MSNDEKDQMYGRAVREHKEQQRHIARLHEKRDRMAESIRHQADRLYEPHCHGAHTLQEVPSSEERCKLINEIEGAETGLKELEGRVQKLAP